MKHDMGRTDSPRARTNQRPQLCTPSSAVDRESSLLKDKLEFVCKADLFIHYGDACTPYLVRVLHLVTFQNV